MCCKIFAFQNLHSAYPCPEDATQVASVPQTQGSMEDQIL